MILVHVLLSVGSTVFLLVYPVTVVNSMTQPAKLLTKTIKGLLSKEEDPYLALMFYQATTLQLSSLTVCMIYHARFHIPGCPAFLHETLKSWDRT